jgi:hypothetical protein
MQHRSTLRDVSEGVAGALGILVDLGTPFLRGIRSRWGLGEEEAQRAYPGDAHVPAPRWSWTHAVEVNAPAEAVWPWVVQIGQGKAGFYSYAWLENLVGCDVQNASEIHPEWQELKVGDAFRLHPKAPPLRVSATLPGHWFVVTGEDGPAPSDMPSSAGADDVRVSWLLLVDPLDATRCRFISRYRVSYGQELRLRLAYGPWPLEAIGFMMDRAMLLGVKRRAEAHRIVC